MARFPSARAGVEIRAAAWQLAGIAAPCERAGRTEASCILESRGNGRPVTTRR